MKLNVNILALFCGLSLSGLYAQQSPLEGAAKKWISDNSRQLGIQPYQDLNLSFVKKGFSGETLRFQQMIGNVPVYQSEIVVHFNPKGEVTHTSESFKKEAGNISTTPAISSESAIQTAKSGLNLSGEMIDQESKLFVIITDSGDTRLAYRVVLKSFDSPGVWETMVDAQSATIISTKDIAVYHNGDPRKETGEPAKSEKSTVNTYEEGTGYVFNPDPLSATGSTYGGQYVDGNDATNASLDAARSLVTIPELELSGGMYKLKGTYVEIAELDTPATGLFLQDSNEFLFNRNEQGFEATNAYWHIDQSLRYINETLGITCVPPANGGRVRFDPHGFQGADNSFYSPAGKYLVFGEGCVDDAEDADVVLHELGHGIDDWMTNGSASNFNGEGNGDYWAQSYSRSLGQWESTDPQYQWMFSWDGHNPCWQGRVTNYSGTYPDDLTGSIHTDGQIWATSLMRIWDRIGKEKTDRAWLEGLAMTNSNTNQQNAAIAVRQAALDMVGQFGFTCADIVVMTEEFTTTGYVLPAYECTDLGVKDMLNGQIASVYPNPASDKLNIIMDFKKPETVVVFNMAGQKVLESQIASNKSFINVSNLPKGVYVLTIKGTSFTYKFVKE